MASELNNVLHELYVPVTVTTVVPGDKVNTFLYDSNLTELIAAKVNVTAPFSFAFTLPTWQINHLPLILVSVNTDTGVAVGKYVEELSLTSESNYIVTVINVANPAVIDFTISTSNIITSHVVPPDTTLTLDGLHFTGAYSGANTSEVIETIEFTSSGNTVYRRVILQFSANVFSGSTNHSYTISRPTQSRIISADDLSPSGVLQWQAAIHTSFASIFTAPSTGFISVVLTQGNESGSHTYDVSVIEPSGEVVTHTVTITVEAEAFDFPASIAFDGDTTMHPIVRNMLGYTNDSSAVAQNFTNISNPNVTVRAGLRANGAKAIFVDNPTNFFGTLTFDFEVVLSSGTVNSSATVTIAEVLIVNNSSVEYNLGRLAKSFPLQLIELHASQALNGSVVDNGIYPLISDKYRVDYSDGAIYATMNNEYNGAIPSRLASSDIEITTSQGSAKFGLYLRAEDDEPEFRPLGGAPGLANEVELAYTDSMRYQITEAHICSTEPTWTDGQTLSFTPSAGVTTTLVAKSRTILGTSFAYQGVAHSPIALAGNYFLVVKVVDGSKPLQVPYGNNHSDVDARNDGWAYYPYPVQSTPSLVDATLPVEGYYNEYYIRPWEGGTYLSSNTDGLSISVISAPTYGSVSIPSSNGLVLFKTAKNDNYPTVGGAPTIVIQVTDVNGEVDTMTVTLTDQQPRSAAIPIFTKVADINVSGTTTKVLRNIPTGLADRFFEPNTLISVVVHPQGQSGNPLTLTTPLAFISNSNGDTTLSFTNLGSQIPTTGGKYRLIIKGWLKNGAGVRQEQFVMESNLLITT